MSGQISIETEGARRTVDVLRHVVGALGRVEGRVAARSIPTMPHASQAQAEALRRRAVARVRSDAARVHDDAEYLRGRIEAFEQGERGGGASSPAWTSTLPVVLPPTAEASRAMAWAQGQANDRLLRWGYHWQCLAFVFDAYENTGDDAGHVDLRSQVDNPKPWADTYPDDIWDRINNGVKGTGTPPPGALVFFSGDPSHVALSIGDGNLISTSDSVAKGIHSETLSQHPADSYRGWWLPDQTIRTFRRE